MPTMRLDFVSQDRLVFSGEVSEILAPGSEGQLGILPRHAPLLTVLAPGEVIVKIPGQEDIYFAVSGGWMEVQPDHVTILARSAERSEEIDLARAEAARRRAEERLRERPAGVDLERALHALKRSRVRLKVAQRRSGWRPVGPSAEKALDSAQEK
ncbi:MAG: F0F1 ATP synthase subunit epsilon [Anaerolineae bacterium]|nr:F0F1 ATP synthase subunit epsilon [Anaerolineae bacterium]